MILRDMKINLSEKEVLRLQGYKPKSEVRDEVKDILVQQIQNGYSLIEPKAVYTIAMVLGMGENTIKLEGDLILSWKYATKVWKDSEYLGIAICTIGSALENRVSELFKEGEYIQALILDSIGSVAVEAVADYVNHLICQLAISSGAVTGRRLSPGYGKLLLKEQRKIFPFLSGEELGVKLTEQYMMVPRKSISFCVGIGSRLPGRRGTNPCQYCDMLACPYRARERTGTEKEWTLYKQ